MGKELTRAELAAQLYEQIEAAPLSLPDHIDRERFVRMVKATVSQDPTLLSASHRSIVMACIKAASDGLFIDGREAAMVIRNSKGGKVASYLPMYQGLMKLARNSGQIISMTANVVYEFDSFRYILGDEERIEHLPAGLDAEPGKPIAVYAVVRMTDGTVVREVMRRAAVLNIAAQGQNAFQYDPAKGRNWAEWWRKTVIRRVCKWLPRSTELQSFHDAAGRIDELVTFERQAPKPSAGAAAIRQLTDDIDEVPPKVLDDDYEAGDEQEVDPDAEV
jgi:recombination protein RecT